MGPLKGSKKPFFSRLALFPTPVVEPAVHQKFEFFWSLTFVLLAVAASLAIVISSWDRPSLLHQLNSSNPTETGYTCGCSVPIALQETSAQAKSEATTGQVILKPCYDKSTEVNNVTLVQFNNRTAADVPNSVQPKPQFYHASNLSGYRVVQEPKEFNLWNGDPDGTLWDICNAIPYQDTIFNFSFNSSQLPIYFDYPLSYMRLAFEYNCSDCSNCSPNQILHPLNISDPWMQIFKWVECSAYAVGVNKETPCNKSTNEYHGRCTLNPTSDISMSKRLTKFLNYIQTRVANLTITTPSPDNTSQHGIEMHANSLYYNQSLVKSNTRVDYEFFEVDQSSASWASLVQKYPNVALGSCSQVDQNKTTEICNGTAICNVFRQMGDNGISTPSVSCMDFRDNYTKCALSANSTGNNDILEDLCGQNPGNNSWMHCNPVPAHTISYEFQPSVNRSELDYQFFTKYMDNKWNSTYATGVCANLYEDRVRYKDSEDHNKVYLLETKCSANGLCHLTGGYNLQNDISPPGTTGTHPIANNSIYTTPQYTCWKLRPQPLFTWAINLIGVLGGWLSTLFAIANLLHGFALTMYTKWCNVEKESLVSQEYGDVITIPAPLQETTSGEIPLGMLKSHPSLSRRLQVLDRKNTRP